MVNAAAPGPVRRTAPLVVAGWAILVATLVAVPTGAGWASRASPSSAVGAGAGNAALSSPSVQGPAYDWPELHQTPLLTGYAWNSPLSTSNAARLGVVWATDLYGAALDSPVVAYDTSLRTTLAYIGTETGNVLAINVSNGQILWGTWLGSPIRSSLIVYDGGVFVGTFSSPRIFKLDLSTGSIDCSVISPQELEGTPTAASPPGGVPTVYIGSNDNALARGPLLAVNAANCALEWSFSAYNQRAGTWDSASYGISGGGVPVVIFGTSDPDSSVYALNAVTGTEVWRFQTDNPRPGAYDVAAGAVISPPGENRFPDGVVYVPNKYGIMYALDLATGREIWQYEFQPAGALGDTGRSTAALDGDLLVFGESNGMLALNAQTGAVVWKYLDPSGTEAISSPAIAGSLGHEIVAVGDVGGALDVVSLAAGTPLYRYQTSGYVTASPAVTQGNILIASTDGFLYDFAVGGGNDATLPSTATSSPLNDATLVNPNGDLSISGMASDPTAGVARVKVAIQQGGTSGPWWNAATRSWVPGPVDNLAILSGPGTSSTSWTFSYPIMAAGGTYQITSYAASVSGQSDTRTSVATFAVLHSTRGPHIQANPADVSPGASVIVAGAGFRPGEQIVISLLGTALASSTASATGSLRSTPVRIPTSAVFGQTSLEAIGQTSHRSATVAIRIANSWEQLGDNAAHTGFETNDPVLNHLVFPGDNQWVRLAWGFDAGAPITGPPVVADGVAYVADSLGQLVALDTQNAGQLWSWTVPSGASIDGSPAVDPVRGLVFVTSADGIVWGISISTGGAVWSTPVHGGLSSPIYASGALYVTSTGAVAALAESTGAVEWSTVLTSSITAAPTLDASAGVLVVVESDGYVVSLSARTGSLNWEFLTQGPVTASAMISGGTVYVGSTDRRLYALNEATGAERWSYLTGGAVTVTASLTDQGTVSGAHELLVGSEDGNLYVLNAADGSLLYMVTLHSAIVGVAAVDGIAIATTASGIVSESRTYTNLTQWKYSALGGLTFGPIIVDGAIYVADQQGDLYAFTSFGQPPL